MLYSKLLCAIQIINTDFSSLGRRSGIHTSCYWVAVVIREPIFNANDQRASVLFPFNTEYHVKMRDWVGHLLRTKWDTQLSHRDQNLPHYLRKVLFPLVSPNVTLSSKEMSHPITHFENTNISYLEKKKTRLRVAGR